MKILWILFSANTAEPWVESLRDLPEHELTLCHYDRFPPPTDRHVLDVADQAKPDLVLYTGSAGGVGILAPSTLARLRKKTPVVFLSGDLGDPPWWPYLKEYRDAGGFDLCINFDGDNVWPKEGKDFTALTPISPRFYQNLKPLSERSIPLGFAGTDSSPSRRAILNHLRETCGLQSKAWENTYGSYQRLADFYKECQIVVNVPFSGSDKATQVKGRVLEAGWAGACLLDHSSSAAVREKWFLPGVHLMTYDSAADAARVCKQMMIRKDLAELIATQLHDRVKTYQSPEVFWNRVFRAIS